MKRLNKLLLVSLLMISIAFMSGCSAKKKVSAEDFTSKLKKKGLIVNNVTESFKGNDKIVKAVFANSKNYTYQIEFFEFKNDSLAKEAYELNMKNFEDFKGSTSVKRLVVNTKNYSKYHNTSNNMYMAVTRVDNTLIYAKVNKEYGPEVEKIIEELGY